ncbi:MAG: C_GCAxxG_C_C family protein [Verrucomicrobia bacterium]|nr:C_GCAxxG_C_C family protein [Verrucomicrobiota bacterium]
MEKGTQVDLRGKGKEMLQRAYQLGYEFEKKHGGCCRCTVAALQRAIDFIPQDDDVYRAATCLDGGATPGGLQNCGAFTGAGIMIGYLCGTAPFGETSLAHRLVRAVYEEFNKAYGSVLCKDVRHKGHGNCPEVVAKASQWTAEAIFRQFTNYRPDDHAK